MSGLKRLTDAAINAVLKKARIEETQLIDSAVPGLSLRIYPSGTASWAQFIRVVGEGGVNKYGKKLLGKKHRLSLGGYPAMSLEAARAQPTSISTKRNEVSIQSADWKRQRLPAAFPYRSCPRAS